MQAGETSSEEGTDEKEDYQPRTALRPPTGASKPQQPLVVHGSCSWWGPVALRACGAGAGAGVGTPHVTVSGVQSMLLSLAFSSNAPAADADAGAGVGAGAAASPRLVPPPPSYLLKCVGRMC